MMRNTLVNLIVTLCCLLSTPIFAEQHIELHPVYSESRQHTGYSAKVKISIFEKTFNLLLDIHAPFTWIPQNPRGILNAGYVHEFCHGKEYHFSECSSFSTTIEQRYGFTRTSVCHIVDFISFLATDNCKITWFAPLAVLKSLEWNEWRDYQGIDGVLGLGALHIDNRFPNEISVFWGTFNYAITPTKMKYNRIFQYNLFKWAIKYMIPFSQITIALPPLDSHKKATLTLGGVNDKLCDKSQTTEPLLLYSSSSDHSDSQYEFKYKNIKMGNITFYPESVHNFAHLHTTQSFISVPDQFLQEIVTHYNAQNENNIYTIDCNISLKPFEMNTNNGKYLVEAKDFVIRRDSTRCVIPFRSAKTVQLGMPFINTYCFTLDLDGEKSIKFAPIK